jgi:hypothetical protein
MLDACDPVSFNDAFGFEVCTPTTPRAGIAFSTLIALLEKHQRAEAWRISPDVIHVTRTVTMTLPNRGGIPHSFTEVEEFGGDFVPILNIGPLRTRPASRRCRASSTSLPGRRERRGR